MRISSLLTLFLAGFIVLHADEVQAASENVKLAITKQINEIDPRNADQVNSTIEVVTISPAKSQLKLSKVKTPKNIKFLKSDVNMKSCSSYEKPCKQRFLISLDANKACRLNGSYDLSFSCKGAGCKKKRFKKEITLQSENFCNTTQISNE